MGGIASPHARPGLRLPEDLSEMSRIWRYEIPISNLLLLKMPNGKDQSSNQIQSSTLRQAQDGIARILIDETNHGELV